MKNSSRLACLIAASVVATSAVPAIAEPVCFMTTGSGRLFDLSGMCGSNAGKGGGVIAAGPKSGIDLNSKERRIKVGETSDGSDVMFDRDKVTSKKFELDAINSKGLFNYTYAYACREGRAFLTDVSFTSATTGRTTEIETARRESMFEGGSMIDTSMQLACRQIGSPGY